MGMPEEPYIWLIVETYRERGSGLHGDIHALGRSLGQVVPTSYRVRFPKAPRRAYKLGQRFQSARKNYGQGGW